MDTKYCGGCDSTKLISEFHRNPRTKDGLGTQCKACNKAFIVEWRKRPEVRAKEQARSRTKERLAYRKQNDETPRGRSMALLCSTRSNAKRYGLLFDIDLSDILPTIEAGKCSVTGIPFDLRRGFGRGLPWAPSVDKLDPTKGYVKGNVRVIVWCLNAALGAWGDSVLNTLVTALSQRSNGQHSN